MNAAHKIQTVILKFQIATELREHDWSFEFSDDHTVWHQGSNQRASIKTLITLLHEQGEDVEFLIDEVIKRATPKTSAWMYFPDSKRDLILSKVERIKETNHE